MIRARTSARPRAAVVALAVAGLALAMAGPGRAGPPGVWVSAGDMSAERGDPDAALLPSGKVLVVGSPVGLTAAGADIYDPGSGAWSPAADPRPGYEAYISLTALRDGRVLLTAAGEGDSHTVELYDPATNSWTVTGPMNVARGNVPAVRLNDGRVLVVGGGVSLEGRRSAEIYNPGTGRWTPTGSMGAPRSEHAAVLLADGRVLVMGGTTGGHDILTDPLVPLASTEVWDPTTGTWSPTGSMTESRQAFSVVLLEDGRVLVSGGIRTGENGGLSVTPTADLYDPAARRWSPATPLPEARAAHSATVVPCGALVTGGFGTVNQGRALANSLLYVPTPGGPGAWTSTGPLSQGRAGHAATLLNGGDVLVAGGYDRGLLPVQQRAAPIEPNGYIRSAERYTPPPCPEVPPPTVPVVPPVTLPGLTAITLPPTTIPGAPPLQGPADPSLPVVVRVDPRSGPVAGGTKVVVSGTRFAGATSLRFGDAQIGVHPCPTGGQAAPTPCFTEESPTRITAYSPAHRAGPVHVSVNTAVGSSGETQADLFEFVEGPLAPGGAEAPAQAGLPGSPGGTSVIPAPPGGSPAVGPSPGGATAPGLASATASAPGGAAAPGGVPVVGGAPGGVVATGAAPTPVGVLAPGGAVAPGPGIAGVRDDAPDFAHESNYSMVRHKGAAGPDGRTATLAGIVTLIACSVRVVSTRRERARLAGACAASEAY